MACDCLDRYLEERILVLDVALDNIPRWRFIWRFKVKMRQASLFDTLYAYRRSQGVGE